MKMALSTVIARESEIFSILQARCEKFDSLISLFST